MDSVKKVDDKIKDKQQRYVKISFRKLSKKEHFTYRIPSYPFLVP